MNRSKGFLSTAIICMIAGAVILIIGIAMNGRVMYGRLASGRYGWGYWDGVPQIVLGIIFLAGGASFFIVRAVIANRNTQKAVMADSRSRSVQESRAAEGDVNSMYLLGDRYFHGNGVEKDLSKAFDNWKQAAESGHPGAMYELAGLFERGEGVSKDEKKALHWYRESDAKGNTDASVKVGEFYRDGKGGIAENASEAFRRFESAAKSGSSLGCFDMGLSYLNGTGCEKNEQLGKNYINRAAQADLPEAKRVLRELMNGKVSVINERNEGGGLQKQDNSQEAIQEKDEDKTVLLNSDRLVLVMKSTGEKIEPAGEDFVIGRSKEKSSFRLDNPSVSSRHASLITKNGRLFIKDLNSSNHTYLNGKVLEGYVETELKKGDIIKLSNEEFKVE